MHMSYTNLEILHGPSLFLSPTWKIVISITKMLKFTNPMSYMHGHSHFCMNKTY